MIVNYDQLANMTAKLGRIDLKNQDIELLVSSPGETPD
jgi:hypothetical protein